MQAMLRNLSIRNKIVLMLLFPLLGLMFFAADGIRDRLELAGEMRDVQMLVTLAGHIGAFVHESQAERGMSAGYLGSGGNQFADQLPLQYQQTDQRARELRAYIDDQGAARFGAELASRLDGAMRMMEQLTNHRRAVQGRTIGAGEGIGLYTRLNATLLEIVGVLAAAITHGETTRMIGAYQNLLLAKEQAGVERAVLTNTFAVDRFEAGMLNRFSALVAAQDIYLANFQAMALVSDRQFYQQRLQGSQVAETERLRKIAFERAAEGRFGVSASHWFEQQSGKINLLKVVEDHVAGSLIERAGALQAGAQRELMLFLLFAAACIGIALALSLAMTRMISGSLRQALAALHDIAAGEGDLTRRLDASSKDEIGQLAGAFNRFAEKIHDLVAQIKTATATIKSSSNEISLGNDNLSQRTEEQASSLEETASSMEEMSSTIKQNVHNTGSANELAANARRQAEQGGAVVDRAVSAMAEINHASKRIADIIAVIDEIAFQTNLLALNASVEAARAGEQGRGFAVVAGEVRNLAQRSAGAAREIKVLIGDTVGKVQQGSKLVNESGMTLQQIIDSVKKVTTLVSDIAAATREQSTGIEQTGKAIMHMDEMTQQNAAMVEQVAAASRSMSAQADTLHALVSQFKVRQQDLATLASAMQGVDESVSAETPSAPVLPSAPTPSASPARVAAPTAGQSSRPFIERRKGNRPWSNRTSGSHQG